MLATTRATLFVLSARSKDENWQWMDAAEDNERRMMLSPPSWAARHLPKRSPSGFQHLPGSSPRRHRLIPGMYCGRIQLQQITSRGTCTTGEAGSMCGYSE